MHTRTWRLAAALLLVGAIGSTLPAQTITSSIVGTVVDPSNSTVAGADLALRQVSTGAERRMVTGMLHQVLLAFIGATAGIMAAVLIGTTGGPRFLGEITLNQIVGYNLLLVSTMIGLRLLFMIFRTQRAQGPIGRYP